MYQYFKRVHFCRWALHGMVSWSSFCNNYCGEVNLQLVSESKPPKMAVHKEQKYSIQIVLQIWMEVKGWESAVCALLICYDNQFLYSTQSKLSTFFSILCITNFANHWCHCITFNICPVSSIFRFLSLKCWWGILHSWLSSHAFKGAWSLYQYPGWLRPLPDNSLVNVTSLQLHLQVAMKDHSTLCVCLQSFAIKIVSLTVHECVQRVTRNW